MLHDVPVFASYVISQFLPHFLTYQKNKKKINLTLKTAGIYKILHKELFFIVQLSFFLIFS
jgi:hypothetical protein